MNYSQFSNSESARFDAMMAEANREAEEILRAFTSDEQLERTVSREEAEGIERRVCSQMFVARRNFFGK